MHSVLLRSIVCSPASLFDTIPTGEAIDIVPARVLAELRCNDRKACHKHAAMASCAKSLPGSNPPVR